MISPHTRRFLLSTLGAFILVAPWLILFEIGSAWDAFKNDPTPAWIRHALKVVLYLAIDFNSVKAFGELWTAEFRRGQQ